MIDIVWKLSISTLEREDEVRPLLEMVQSTTGFRPDRYDLNRRSKWRTFDLERAVVDTLTQRTQLVRIDGELAMDDADDQPPHQETVVSGDETQVVIATGKHDEQPTCMIRLAVDDQQRGDAVIKAAQDWGAVCRNLPIDRVHVTGPEIRNWLLGLVGSQDQWPEQSMPAAYVVGWPAGRVPHDWDRSVLEEVTTDETMYPHRVGGADASVLWWSDPGASTPLDDGHGGRVTELLDRLVVEETGSGWSSS